MTDTAATAKVREPRLVMFMRALAGPALSAMIAGVVLVLTFGTAWGLWETRTETLRIHYVGGIGLALAMMLGVLVWRMDGSKLGVIEMKLGPGSFRMGEDDDDVKPAGQP